MKTIQLLKTSDLQIKRLGEGVTQVHQFSVEVSVGCGFISLNQFFLSSPFISMHLNVSLKQRVDNEDPLTFHQNQPFHLYKSTAYLSFP